MICASSAMRSNALGRPTSRQNERGLRASSEWCASPSQALPNESRPSQKRYGQSTPEVIAVAITVIVHTSSRCSSRVHRRRSDVS